LAAGLVIVVACFTGAVLVFEDELQHAFNKERYFVQPQAQQLPIEVLVKNLKQAVPLAKINSIKIYANTSRTVEISYSEKKPNGDQKNNSAIVGKRKKENSNNTTKKAQQDGTKITAFVNPYTGNIVELYNYKNSFFFTMMSLHRWLLSGDVGKLIVGISTLLFLFILITGLILWWYKTKAIFKQRLNIKFAAGWKRINHDLHIVLGFYTAIFLFIFAFTALAWSFQWFNDGIYTVTNSTKEQPKPPISSYDTLNNKLVKVDSVYRLAKATIQEAQYYTIQLPKDSLGVFTVLVLTKTALHETATDSYYFNQYSGNLLNSVKFSDKNLGQRVRANFKPIHLSSIFGLPSKIIGFIVCLLGVSFPITGTIMWLNRIKKKK
jgi:uncharacterized iron-regulated membrane protein